MISLTDVTVGGGPSRGTEASVEVDSIDAHTTIPTRIAWTLVNICRGKRMHFRTWPWFKVDESSGGHCLPVLTDLSEDYSKKTIADKIW